MCNCNFSATSLTTESKEASAKTIELKETTIRDRTKKLIDSLEKQQEYAKKGLLVAHSLKIEQEQSGKKIVVFDSSSYGFLNNAAYDTIHPNLQDHALINGNMGLFRVNRISAEEADLIDKGEKVEAKLGDVFQIRGYDLANMTVVMGETGWIVMDVLTSEETAKAALQLLLEHVSNGSLPIKAIIYSHSHADHYAGVGGLITQEEYDYDGDDKDKIIQIYAPQGFLENAVSENVYAGNAMTTRAAFMYGTNLPQNERGQVDAGLGKATSKGTKTLFNPKTEISFDRYKENCNYQEIEVDGITMQFQLTPGTEAPSEMNVYLPDFKVLFIAENCCGTLHNLYTLRGAEVRDALTWANYLDETIATFSDVQTICSSHNWPQFNESEIENHVCIEYLKKQRNIYRYLGNTTLNLINKGYTIEEVGRKMETMMPALMLISAQHFSTYGIGYNQSTPKFTDVGTHWAKNDIDFVVARGLLSGTSSTTFSPDTGMTRGMFVTALGRLAGVDTTKYQSTKFTDVKADAYYAPYVAWADTNNIVNGTGKWVNRATASILLPPPPVPRFPPYSAAM